MMFGFGDDQNPYTESVDLLEDLVIEYITEMVIGPFFYFKIVVLYLLYQISLISFKNAEMFIVGNQHVNILLSYGSLAKILQPDQNSLIWLMTLFAFNICLITIRRTRQWKPDGQAVFKLKTWCFWFAKTRENLPVSRTC